MCEFISFKIEKSPEGLKIITAPDLENHDKIPGNGHEGEWGKYGTLDIRIPLETSDNVKAELEAFVKKTYKTRQKMIDKLIVQYLASGILPDHFYEHSKLNNRKLRLFACDCAERVLPIFEKAYPNDSRPRVSIETARKFANGRTTREEMAAARDAARDAAKKWQAERLLQYIKGE